MRMVGAVVDALGPPFPGDSSLKAFPSAQSIASLERAEFEDSVRLGYRGPYIHELARGVARRDLDLDALQSANLSSAELRRRLLSIKGVGPYAASTLAMILGRYDQVAVDSEFRRFVSATYFGGRRVPDSEAVAIYDEWEAWKYLAYWFDLTRRESPPLAAT